MPDLLACTGDRLARLTHVGGRWRADTALEGTGAQCLAVDPTEPSRIFVGCRGNGLLRSLDGGARWERTELPEDDVFSVAISRADGAVYAGTEPSRLFRSRDGRRFEELRALQQIPSRQSWSYPPRPWTSHVRWIAPDPHRRERLLAGIELGGVMYSGDGGHSFGDHRPGAQRDVHMLAWHPAVEGRAYEAAGGGAAWSRDGGQSWEGADRGRDRHYCWALAVDPDDPDRWFVSAAAGPRAAHGRGSADAGLYRWEGDGPWRRVQAGLPEPLDSMVYALSAANHELIAGLRDGRMFRSGDRGDTWRSLGVRLDSLVALAPVPG
jgi:hypothetical protein